MGLYWIWLNRAEGFIAQTVEQIKKQTQTADTQSILELLFSHELNRFHFAL